MSRIIIGVDPGCSGACAALNADGSYVTVFDLPIISDKSLRWVDGGELHSQLLAITAGHSARAVVERVSAMPGQGVSSSVGCGMWFGAILATLQVLQLPIGFVTPASWKRALGLSSDKKASLHKARLMFPMVELHLAKHEGRAEALLIASWGLRMAT